ncbi:hypothetical protein [Bradyrhizobium sp. USDA 329]|uniref:hypothetical protein n=1 Tax=unclassified Bradyrhizobium TaxID=2631580 RepID=UPI003512C3D9
MRVYLISLMCPLIATVAQAQEISAICRYEYSIDDQGKKSDTAGEFSLKATYMLPAGKPLNVQLRTTKAPCFDFLATGDDMRIEGGCVRMLEKMKVYHRFTIDRVSGSFEESVQFNDKAGLIHYGRCTPARPLL